MIGLGMLAVSPFTFEASEWADRMLSAQHRLIQIAIHNQLEKDKYHLQKSNDSDITIFPINSFVLLKYPTRPPHKLAMPNSGPYRVVQFIGAKYTIMNLINNKTKTPNSNLIPYQLDEYTDPRLIANKDKEYFDVEKVLSHSGDKPTNMLFHVKWVGFDTDTSKTSYLSFKDLVSNEQLHKYLIRNRMKNLISKNYKHLYKDIKNGTDF
jgi:hypothetical protein